VTLYQLFAIRLTNWRNLIKVPGVQNIDIRLVEATDPPGWVRTRNSDSKAATVQAPLIGL
jgi:hypothetical protein